MSNRLKSIIIWLGCIFLLSAFWFYPSQYSTCRGGNICYGCVATYNHDRLVLNAKKSTLEIRKEKVYNCLGVTRGKWVVFDACNGDWGWFAWRDVDCKEILARCKNGDQLPLGITCDEWQRACAEISDNDIVHLKITDYRKTGITINCDSNKSATFPGGETEFAKFLNLHFQFPDSIKGKKVDGQLNVSVIIDTTGYLKDMSFGEPKILDYYEKECRRVFEIMPSWSVAYCDKRKVEWRGSYLFQFTNVDPSLQEVRINVSAME
jgi:hypothetical protein